MTIDEAIAWLKGERSTTNSMQSSNQDARIVLTAEADAAMMVQAYMVLKAHKEGLIDK